MARDKPERIRKLYRSRKNKVLGGVCGGLAEYADMEPAAMRILWVLSALLLGIGVLLYVAALFIVPVSPTETPSSGEEAGERRRFRRVGTVFLVFGILFLLSHLDLIDLGWAKVQFFPWRLVWPLTLIGFGLYLLVSGATFAELVARARRRAAASRLTKTRDGRMIFGICSGVGRYYRVDPTVVRMIWVFFTLLSEGVALILYYVLALLLPYDEAADRERAGAKP